MCVATRLIGDARSDHGGLRRAVSADCGRPSCAAFKIVQDRWPDASLTLVGGGAQESDLRALVAQLALRNVTFAGRATPTAIAAYYADHDLYIQSPNIDNVPTSVLEACRWSRRKRAACRRS